MSLNIIHQLTDDYITPTLLQTRSSNRASRTVAIPLANSSDHLLLLKPAARRNGEHILFFDDEEDALEAVAILSTIGTFELVYDEVPAWEMLFAVVGEIELSQDEETLVHWTVRVPFQEVAS